MSCSAKIRSNRDSQEQNAMKGKRIKWGTLLILHAAAISVLALPFIQADDDEKIESTASPRVGVGKKDWPQLGGDSHRNNVTEGHGIPDDWDFRTGKNIRWSVSLGSQTYGNIVVANGRVFVGTNNGHGYLSRYDQSVDLGVLLCFREMDGKFLWQHSCEKLPTGRVHDWPYQGIASAPVVEGDRLWLVTNRGEVTCLDTNGFHDNQNDGPYDGEFSKNRNESDVVWTFDMMKELGVRQHNLATCAPTIWKNTLFVCTSNGVDESHIKVPAPDSPSFIAMDKRTGKVLWTDNSPGSNILHGQWSCPVVGVFDGIPQVIFPGGDGWLYSFHAEKWSKDGKPELLWKFDGNPKESIWRPGGSGSRNNIVAVPVIHDGKIFAAMGQDPEHGPGPGILWCLDPTRRGDVSSELLLNPDNKADLNRRNQAIVKWIEKFQIDHDEKIIAALNNSQLEPDLEKVLQANGINVSKSAKIANDKPNREWRIVQPDNAKQKPIRIVRSSKRIKKQLHHRYKFFLRSNEKIIANPNSAVVWQYGKYDEEKWSHREPGETCCRTIASPVIKNDLLFIPDIDGFLHCLNAKTGKRHWHADLLAAGWATPLIVNDKVYVADEDGEVAIFDLDANPEQLEKVDGKDFKYLQAKKTVAMPTSIYCTPVVANNTLYIATKDRLYALDGE